MRSPLRTTLLLSAAFALGLAVGGDLPRQAGAQDVPPEGLAWWHDGTTLTLANLTEDVAFLVQAWTREEVEDPALGTRVDKELALPLDDYEKVMLYKLQPLYECDSRGCRPCNEGRIRCPSPDPITLEQEPLLTSLEPAW